MLHRLHQGIALIVLLIASVGARANVDYAIVVTGGELLAGELADAHTVYLTRTLRSLGLRCVASLSVDDEADDIQAALRFATGKARLVIMTGGLGPTENDITRETIARFTSIELREDPMALQEMERRLNTPRDQLRPNLRRQTLVPARGTYLKNSSGTAVGLIYEAGDNVIVALPGPPRELQPMVRDELIPWLGKRFGTSLPGSSIMLRFVGLGQSQISQTLTEHVPLPSGVIVGSHFEGSRVDFTFSLRENSPQAQAQLDRLKERVLARLGQHVYADDLTTLEERVAKLLAARNATLALAEVGSGGALAAALNSAASAPQVVAGAFAAPTEDRLRQLLKVTDARWSDTPAATRPALLASAAAEQATTTWAFAVSEVQPHKDGAFVQVVLRRPDGQSHSQRLPVRGSGELARANLTTQILDMLRRQLQ